mmetsp:Transcript_78033/g.216384  ORF Transcript_78033/g.216384 Transcript_78033/m.216384 type:complete len:183 (+) Transcript_78033:157-705(+)
MIWPRAPKADATLEIRPSAEREGMAHRGEGRQRVLSVLVAIVLQRNVSGGTEACVLHWSGFGVSWPYSDRRRRLKGRPERMPSASRRRSRCADVQASHEREHGGESIPAGICSDRRSFRVEVLVCRRGDARLRPLRIGGRVNASSALNLVVEVVLDVVPALLQLFHLATKRVETCRQVSMMA